MAMGKLNVGMIGGGGPGCFFGMVHRRAVALDASRDVVAGALRSNPDAAMSAADDWGIKGYPSADAMIAAHKAGEIKLDYATIVTPNYAHFAPAKACLEAGIPLVCEKPMTMTVEEAEELGRLVESSGVPFVLAHTYTGHAMMMLARTMVENGDIGRVRKVESWYNQGWLADDLESSGQQQASWRTDPSRAGISCCGGDIGTHAFIAATWVSGLKVTKVSARLNTFVEGRTLDDDFNVIAEMDNGATALITATQIAVGYKNDNGFRVFGTPWPGTFEYVTNKSAPLRCLFLLASDGDFEVVDSPGVFLRTVLPLTYFRTWDIAFTEFVLDFLKELYQTLPVYRVNRYKIKSIPQLLERASMRIDNDSHHE